MDNPSDDEIKVEIARLKLRRASSPSVRRMTSAKAEENARWRERRAGRFKGITGGFMGSMIQSQRCSERMEHADLINRRPSTAIGG